MTHAQENPLFYLGDTGPYVTGWRATNYIDYNRGDRRVLIRITYPALGTPVRNAPINNADPDLSGAPYPLILSGEDQIDLFTSHLPSYGFVTAVIFSVTPGTGRLGNDLIDTPRDLVFLLDQLATNPPEQLVGMIDTNHTGVIGYSSHANYALAAGGARIDPEYYQSFCAEPALDTLGYPEFWNEYACTLFTEWEAFAANAGDAVTTSSDGLWQSVTDERIRAVAPGGAEGMLIYGERGLAAVNRPTLLMSGSADEINPYALETVPIFEHLGTTDRTLITFVDQGHNMILTPDRVRQMRHFYTAFFGYHLQGRTDYAALFDEAYVSQSSDLAWGVYPPD